MRLNNDWLTKVSAMFGQVDSFKIYEGTLPATVGVPTGQGSNFGELSTASAVTGLSVPAGLTGSVTSGDFFNNGLGVVLGEGGTFYKMSLTTAGDMATASFVHSASVTGYVYSHSFSSDGKYLYTTDGVTLTQHTLATNWDLTTITQNTQSIDIPSGNASIGGLEYFQVSEDGLHIMLVNYSDSVMFEYVMSVANDLTTAVFNSSGASQISAQFSVSPDGLKLYGLNNSIISGGTNPDLLQYSMTVPYDLSTLSLNVAATFTPSQLYYGGVFIDFTSGILIGMSLSSQAVLDTYLIPSSIVDAPSLLDLSSDFTTDLNNTFAAVADALGTNMVWQGSPIIINAATAGTMGYFVAQVSNGAESFKFDGTITAVGGGGDLELSTVDLVNGDTFTLNGFTFVLNDVYGG